MGNSEEVFTEKNWQALTLLEKKEASGEKRLTRRWAAFPQKAVPDRAFYYPDIHFPYQDVAFLAYLDAKCLEMKPTHIIIIGDLLDCYSMSSFDKDPDRKETLWQECLGAHKWLAKLREDHPDATIIFIEGNHEERIRRQIKRYLPGLHDMPALTVPHLLKLDKYNIQHYDSYGFIRWGVRHKHGESVAKWSCNNEMLKHRTSGISGHTHRKQEASFTDGEGHHTIWRSIGHACDLDKADYTKAPNWVHCGGAAIYHPSGESEWEYLEG